MNKHAIQLLDIKAVFLSPKKPFTWASGIKSPIYCDNRLTLSFPKERNDIEEGLAKLVAEKFPDFDVLMGTATAGIPHAAYISQILQKPMGYVRSSAKDHGRNNKIEGYYRAGQKVVVIEDLISTGKSSIEVVDALKEAELDVLGVVSIFTYEFESARKTFDEYGIPYYSLVTYSELLETALANNRITDEELASLKEWRKDPKNWWKE